MAGFVPNESLHDLFEALVGKTTLSASAGWLGLATDLNPSGDTAATTLSTIVEVPTAGYVRVSLPAWGSASTTAPIQITIPTQVVFSALAADMVDPANYIFLTNVATGTAGKIRYIWELADPISGRSGESLNIAPNSLLIE